MKLCDTVDMMNSSDYKERFRAEYAQLQIRTNGLKNMLEKWDKGELDFTPTCPRNIYDDQMEYMVNYMTVLANRAMIEGVDVTHLETTSSCLTFGKAIEVAKSGAAIFRHGWNGKSQFVVYQKGYPDGIPCNKQTAEAWGIKMGDLFKCEPYLQIKLENGSHAMWTPTVADVLADDWEIVR